MIQMIVAYDQNRAIGAHNHLLWGISELKNDMQRFRELTTGTTVVMGRKTYDSIGKALPNRRNIVVSRTTDRLDDAELASSIEDALKLCENEAVVNIIGGGEIYKLALPYTDIVFATEVQHKFDNADIYFPELVGSWHAVNQGDFGADESNKYPHKFMKYERR